MITLSEQLTTYIFDCIRTAAQAKMTSLVFEQGVVKGMQEGAAFVLIEREGVPVFPFDNLSINRVDVLLSRFNMLSKTGMVVTLDMAERVRDGATLTYVKKITMSAGTTTVEFRCAHPNVLKIPSKLADVHAYEIMLTPEIVEYLKRGQTAMGAEFFTINMAARSIQYEITDVNNDVISHTAGKPVVLDSEASLPVKYSYSFKTTIDLLKLAAGHPIYVTLRLGYLVLKINGLTTYIARNA